MSVAFLKSSQNLKMSQAKNCVVYSRENLLSLQYAPASLAMPANLCCDVSILKAIFKKSSQTKCLEKSDKISRSHDYCWRNKGLCSDDKDLVNHARSILNKLSPETFEKLSSEFLRLKINNINQLTSITRLIYDKAIHDPTYSELYARLCLKLSNVAVSVPKDPKGISFLYELRKVCKGELLNKHEGVDAEKEKRRKIGNAYFIGYLFKAGLIKPHNINVAQQLLLKEVTDLSLETFCALLFVCGKEMSQLPEFKSKLQSHFDDLLKLRSSPKISKRIKFRIDDLMDFKDAGFSSTSHSNPLNSKVPMKVQKEEKIISSPSSVKVVARESVDKWEKLGKLRSNISHIDSVKCKEPAAAMDIDEESIEIQVSQIINRALAKVDKVRAAIELRELSIPKHQVHRVVFYTVNLALEKKQWDRDLVGDLLHELVLSQQLSKIEFKKGLIDVLDLWESYILDIPKFWTYLDQIMAPTFKSLGTPMIYFKKHLEFTNKARP